MSYKEIAEQIGALVEAKNVAYGSAFKTSAEALKLLFPNGIQPTQFEDLGLLIRIWDKMMRIATRKDAFGESPFRDIAGYGILGAEKDAPAPQVIFMPPPVCLACGAQHSQEKSCYALRGGTNAAP